MFLEQHTFAGRTADFVWMVMLGMFTLLPLPLIVPSIELPFCSASLVFMLLYLWSRENPNANTSIMGMVTLKAFYLPWGMMALTMLMGGSVLPDFLGGDRDAPECLEEYLPVYPEASHSYPPCALSVCFPSLDSKRVLTVFTLQKPRRLCNCFHVARGRSVFGVCIVSPERKSKSVKV